MQTVWNYVDQHQFRHVNSRVARTQTVSQPRALHIIMLSPTSFSSAVISVSHSHLLSTWILLRILPELLRVPSSVVLVVSCDVFRLKKLSSELACGCTSCRACWLSLQTFELQSAFRLLVPPVPTCTSVLQSGQQSLVSIVNLSLFLLN